MQTKNDTELLREYAATKSEAAFGEIVRRYADLVYSASLRQVGDTEQARDVAQTVFADLARKAGSLSANTLLIGWLYRGARLAALEQLRNDRRRIERERQAMELLNSSPEIPNDWNVVRPVLDEAIASLGNEDRDALLLRFFKNESLASVGAALGVSEDAAQKRVSRALEKLREFLARRGISTTAAALSVALAANVVQAAPSGFVASLAAGSLAKAATAANSSAPFLKLFTFTNMKTAILVLVLAGGIGGLTFLQLNTQRQLRAAQVLAQQQADEIAALRAANEHLANQANELEQLRRQAQDIPRLRGEVAQLRREKAAQKSVVTQVAQSETNSPPEAQELQIHMTARFVTVPAGYFNGGATGLLTEQQFKTISQALENVGGVTIRGTPEMTTLSGREAQLSVTQTIPFGDSYTNVGVTLDVIPNFSTNTSTFDLKLTAELRELVDASAQQDGSQSDVRLTTITNSVSVPIGETLVLQQALSDDRKLLENVSEAGPFVVTNGFQQVPINRKFLKDDSQTDTQTAATTNSASVPDSQFALARNANVEAGPRSLLVFVTPVIIDPAGNLVKFQPATSPK